MILAVFCENISIHCTQSVIYGVTLLAEFSVTRLEVNAYAK